MSTHAIFRAPEPFNEPVRDYAPGSPEREALRLRLQEMETQQLDIPLVIGGEEVRTGSTFEAVQPHKRSHVLATVHKGGAKEVERAVAAAAEAWNDWSRTPWEDRAAIFLRAAELLAGPWRPTLNAATMLGQSKTAHQAEIDAACEVIDFWRFNVSFMTRIYEEQPVSSPGVWNRLEYRPLEGFVFAVTPFNFTAIGANLPTSVALMGNTVVSKPASTAAYSAWFLLQLLVEEMRAMKFVDDTDFGNFMGAVIDDSTFKAQKAAIDEEKAANGSASVLVGGGYDDSEEWFVEPTVIETTDPDLRTMKEE